MLKRAFLKSSVGSGLAAGLGLGGSGRAAEAGGGDRIRVGLIGCGGRGAWIAELFQEHGGFELAAVADYFPDRARSVGEKFGVADSRCFRGLGGYRRMLEDGGLDAVAIMSPPFFHPEQAAAAVDAGVNVYLAKPVAVDVPGCRSIEASGVAAKAKGLAFLVDFQTRADPLYGEAVRRVHDGALGEICFGESLYHAGRLPVQGDPSGPEGRLRNWVFDRALSGDIITEQNIHTLDVMSWVMDRPPVRATGTGGRRVRTDVGDCWDHFALMFDFGDGVGTTFSSRQFDAHGTPGGIINRVFGSKGVLLAEYGGEVMIRGSRENFFRGGKSEGIYRDGAVANIGRFAEAIRQREPDTGTVAPSVQSNLITILGRTAAYEGRTVTWDEIVSDRQAWAPDLDGLDA